jgi:Antp family protein
MHGHYPTGGHEMDAQMHHYTQTHHNASMPPFPRYPPYDRMGYYNQSMDPAYSRPDSPSSQVGNVVMGPQQAQQPPQQNGTMQALQQQPQQQQQPIVYTSCKLQAAVGNGGLGMVVGDNGSPPLEQMGHHNHMGNQQMQMGHHGMHGQVNEVKN